MIVLPGFPRAGGSANLSASSPMVVAGVIFGTDAVSVASAGQLGDAGTGRSIVSSGLFLWNGTGWDRVRNNSAANLGAVTQPFAKMIAPPGEWSIVSFPAANTQATATIAAGGAGVRHVARSIHFSLAAGATAAAALNVFVRDGATGVGTVIWAGVIAAPVGDAREISLPVHLLGTANTAMTIEFAAAAGATTVEACTLTGYSTV